MTHLYRSLYVRLSSWSIRQHPLCLSSTSLVRLALVTNSSKPSLPSRYVFIIFWVFFSAFHGVVQLIMVFRFCAYLRNPTAFDRARSNRSYTCAIHWAVEFRWILRYDRFSQRLSCDAFTLVVWACLSAWMSFVLWRPLVFPWYLSTSILSIGGSRLVLGRRYLSIIRNRQRRFRISY